ncbi:MAG: pyrimidine dimer DNA glycosylase/endonuclease V [Bacteroidetes bacterium]|nr:pyrimidine dimer DNA glycosylase/endonuclease V [Bacteroidota bacterium]
MRLWSIDPKYLDAKGLVAVWREGLLALAVVQGKTRGYTNHPQLHRFIQYHSPIHALNAYLTVVWHEAERRGYQFSRSKIRFTILSSEIEVTSGQLMFELSHLKRKLYKRDREMYKKVQNVTIPDVHPLFYVVEGPVEKWERLHK